MYYLFIFLVFSFVCYGATELVVYMRGPFAIMEKFRNMMGKLHPEFGLLLGCEYCTCMWVSILLSIINMIVTPTIAFTPFNLILGSSGIWWLIIILDSLLGCAVSWLLFRLEDALTAIKEKNQTYEDE